MAETCINVLLVEDNQGDARLLREYIDEGGRSQFNVIQADTLAAGLEIAQKDGIDVVLLDLNLPDSRGLDTVKEFCENVRGVPVLVMSGLEDERLAASSLEAGAQDYLLKETADLWIRRALRYAVERYRWFREFERSSRLIDESRMRLNTIIESSADGIVIVDSLGVTRFVNPACERMFGRKKEDMINRSLELPIAAGDGTEIDIVGESGKKATVHVRVVQLDWEGQMAYLATLRDITSQMEDKERITHLNNVLHAITDINHLIVVSGDARGLIEKTCDILIEKQGYESAWAVLFDERDEIDAGAEAKIKPEAVSFERMLRKHHYPECVRKALEEPGVLMIRDPERECRDCRLYHNNDCDGLMVSGLRYDDKVHGLLGVSLPVRSSSSEEEIALFEEVVGDISYALKNIELEETRCRMEEELKRSEEQYRAIFENSQDGINLAEWDPETKDKRLIDMNQKFIELSGYTKTELLLESPYGKQSHSRPDSNEREYDAWMKGETCSGEFSWVRPDGRENYIEFSSIPVTIAGRRYILGIDRDITLRKKAEEDRVRTEKLESIGLLAGGIAHDFNNFLTTILANLSMAKDEADEEGEARELIVEAVKAARRARDMTMQLLTFSKGGAPIRRASSIGELIVDSANFAVTGSKVRCGYSIPDDVWAVEVDEGQINQVINNLIINADQAMPEGGTINVTLENVALTSGHTLPLKDGRYVKISIEDRGIGITPEHLSKIFDPYFTTKKEGSGLGLASCYSIIKKHDGHIAVESRLGKGSAFHVFLPAIQRQKVVIDLKEEKIIQGKGRILVMDDDRGIRNTVNRMMRRIGYTVKFANEGRRAVSLYREALESGEPFDAVILDLTIPGGMGGEDVIKALLQMDPAVKAIVSSGYSDDPIMAEFERYGFTGIIAKPYEIVELSKVLKETIGN